MPRMRHYRKALGLAAATLLAAASPALAQNTPAEAANKKVVLDFYQALNDAEAARATGERIQGIAEKYISPGYVQHSEMFANLPGPGSARDKLVRMFQGMPPMSMPPSRTLAVMAEGDRVMLLTARDMPDPATGTSKPNYIFNMFRLKDRQLLEHWSVSEMPSGPRPGAAGGGPGTRVPGSDMPAGAVPPGAAASMGKRP